MTQKITISQNMNSLRKFSDVVFIEPYIRADTSQKELKIHQFLKSMNVKAVNVQESLSQQNTNLSFSPKLQQAFEYRSLIGKGRNSLLNRRYQSKQSQQLFGTDGIDSSPKEENQLGSNILEVSNSAPSKTMQGPQKRTQHNGMALEHGFSSSL